MTPSLSTEYYPWKWTSELIWWLSERDHQVRGAYETHSDPGPKKPFGFPTGARTPKLTNWLTSPLTGDVQVGRLFAASVLESGELPASEAWAAAQVAAENVGR